MKVQPPPLSLYIHLPWCVQKCPYCDFNSHRAPGQLPEQAYVDALLADWLSDRYPSEMTVVMQHWFENLDVAEDGRVFWIERTGALQIWDPATGQVTLAGSFEVSRKGENGLLGLALAPDRGHDHHRWSPPVSTHG